ncbi:hypothetical protein PZA11_001752 [Diplocarpon coronariae]
MSSLLWNSTNEVNQSKPLRLSRSLPSQDILFLPKVSQLARATTTDFIAGHISTG